ncbi:MAG: LysR family transcriptional regulator [Asticcacaulis sp.]|uniref:LysR family transcriptional regulator n=1 Tax=Asticcacaulis sp. TaxID=1872648 RepID=UPI0039E3AF12
MRGSEFAELRAFATIVEQGNFARAASLLRMSPSSLSQTLRTLEERLDVRLLNRTTRSLSVTEAGERLLARFRPALLEMEAAVTDARNLRDRPAGTVRLQTPRGASTTLIEPLLGPFFELYPDIILDITIDDRLTDIVEAGMDVGIRLGDALEDDMVGVRISQYFRHVVVASPDYVARHGAPQTPKDLLSHRCINWRWPGQVGLYSWDFSKDGIRMSIAPNGPLVVSHRDTAVNAAMQGVGIAFCGEYMARPLVEAGRLVTLLDAWCPPQSGWYLCYHKQRHLPVAVRTFIDFIRARIETEAF